MKKEVHISMTILQKDSSFRKIQLRVIYNCTYRDQILNTYFFLAEYKTDQKFRYQ